MKKLRVLSIFVVISIFMSLLSAGLISNKVKAAEVPVTVKVITGYTIPEDQFYPTTDKAYFVGTQKGDTIQNLFLLQNGVITKISNQEVKLALNPYDSNHVIKYKFNDNKSKLIGVINEDIHYDLTADTGVNSGDYSVVDLSTGEVKAEHYDYDTNIPVELAKVVTSNIPGANIPKTNTVSAGDPKADEKVDGGSDPGERITFWKIEGTDEYYGFKCEFYTESGKEFHSGVVNADGKFKDNVQPQLVVKTGQVICETSDENTKATVISVLDNNLKETYSLTSNDYQEIKIDKDNYLYLGDTNRGETIDGVTKYPFMKINLNDPKDITEMVDKISDYPMVSMDGNIWFIGFRNSRIVISKLENGHSVEKYSFDKMPTAMMIKDDHNIVFPFINEGIAGIVTVSPNQNPDADTQREEVAAAADTTSNENSISAKVQDITIDKEKTNVVNVEGDSAKATEVRVNAAAIQGGSGAVKVESHNTVVNLPISAIDFSDLPSNAQVVLSQTQAADTSVLNQIQKAVNKVYVFNLEVQDGNGAVVKSIHNFKDGKATITIKLTDEDIKNLDTSKMAIFYYNEETGKFESMGGTFDSEAKTFTFETPHFSKYILAEAASNGEPQAAEILPQTGSQFDTFTLVILGIFMLVGGVLLTKKN